MMVHPLLHFLSYADFYACLLTLPDIANDSDDSEHLLQASNHDLSRRVKYHQKMIQNFWEEWQKEHLTSTQGQHSSLRNKHFSEAVGKIS